MINILPPIQKKLVRRIRMMRIITTYLISITVLAVAALVLLLPTYQIVHARAETLRSHTQELQANGVLVAPDDIAALQARTKLLREKLTAKVPVSPLTYIDITMSHEVSGVRFVGFEMQNLEKHVVQVRGTATTRVALQSLITALQKDTRIAIVDSPITNFVKSTESEFTLTLTFVQP